MNPSNIPFQCRVLYQRTDVDCSEGEDEQIYTRHCVFETEQEANPKEQVVKMTQSLGCSQGLFAVFQYRDSGVIVSQSACLFYLVPYLPSDWIALTTRHVDEHYQQVAYRLQVFESIKADFNQMVGQQAFISLRDSDSGLKEYLSRYRQQRGHEYGEETASEEEHPQDFS